MTDKPDYTDAEFEVVSEPPPSIPLLVSAIIGGVALIAVSIYFGGQAEGSGQSLWLGMAGAGFAGAFRAAWKLFPALSEQRRAARGGAGAQTEQPPPDTRKRLR